MAEQKKVVARERNKKYILTGRLFLWFRTVVALFLRIYVMAEKDEKIK